MSSPFVFLVKEPKKYEAYLYRWTVNSTGKKYIGWHKGLADGHYLHSGEDKQFAIDFAKGDNLGEVLDFGNCYEMATKENEMLLEVDAKNNLEYYNGSNGGGAYVQKSAYKDIYKLLESIENLDGWKVGMMDKHELNKLKKFQVRTKNTDQVHINVLADIMKDLIANGGNMSEWTPCVILIDYNGNDWLFGGNHTCDGAVKERHVVDVPVIRIPKSTHKNFTKTDLKGLSTLLNRPPEKRQKDNEREELIQYIVEKYEIEGVPIDAKENKDYLKANRKTSRETSGIIRTIRARMKAKENIPPGWRMIDWTSTPNQKDVKDIVDGYNSKPNTFAFNMSSGNFDFDTVMDKLDALLAMKDKRRTVMVVLTHPSSPTEMENWENTWKSVNKKRAKKVCFYGLTQEQIERGEKWNILMHDLDWMEEHDLG